MFPLAARRASSNSLYNIIRRGLLLCLTSAALAMTSQAQQPKDAAVLEPGKPIERELAGDASHSYSIMLTATQFLHVVVEQKGIDVVVKLFAPDGKQLTEVDSPNGSEGPEPIFFVAEAAGSYRLEIRSLEAKAPAGRYQVKLEELRAAKPQDTSQIAAQQAYAEGAQFESEGSAGSRRKAIDKYQEALLLWRAADDRAKEASTLNEIGLIYDSLGEKQKALASYAQALPLFRALGDRLGEAKTISNIGLVYNTLGETQKALESYNQALPLLRAAGDRRGEGATLSNIGAVYYPLGENQKALDSYNQALSLFRAVGDRRAEAITLNNIGLVYFELGGFQKALDFYDQVLRVFRDIGGRSGEAVALNNIGMVYASLGEKRKALDYVSQALPLYHEVGDRGGEAYALNNIGKIYTSLGEKRKALDAYGQALPLLRAVGDRYGEATTLNNIGLVYDEMGETQKAFDYFNQALPLRRAVGDRGGEAITLSDFAKVERDRGNLTEARSRIEAAITIFESLRTKIATQELRASYFATIQGYYILYIDILMRLHKQQPSAGFDGAALQASERGRARSLLETLAEAGADIRQGVDPKLVERERLLQRQFNAKAQTQMKLLSGPHTEAQAEAIAKEIEALTTDYLQIEAEIRQKSPNYAALTQPQPLSLKEIQAQVLDHETLLLEYSLGDERSYLWAVTPTSITSYELPKRDEIETLARQVYSLLTDAKRWKAGDIAGQRDLTLDVTKAVSRDEALTRLSQILLAPIAAQLGKKRLLIIADGALQYIPFGALMSRESRVGSVEWKRNRGRTESKTSGGRNSDSRPQTRDSGLPLIIDHEIVSLPSASTLAVLRQQVKGRKPAAKTIAVLADPVFERNDQRVSQTITREGDVIRANTSGNEKRELPLDLERSAGESGLRDAELKIKRLPATRVEATQILSLVPPSERKEAFDFAANRTIAMSDELSQYRYLHFATHGFLNSVHPELSGIVLSMVDEKGQPQDGFLRAHEVFNLKLPAELVVLSACQTGLGKEVRGEGLVGLTRGFMYAGSPRVVVSLWSVSDRATAELMTRFYRGMLQQKLRPSAALRAAQVSLMKEKRWQAPFYWAAFTLQGEWR